MIQFIQFFFEEIRKPFRKEGFGKRRTPKFVHLFIFQSIIPEKACIKP